MSCAQGDFSQESNAPRHQREVIQAAVDASTGKELM